MIRKRISQWKRCFETEIRRVGFDMDYATELDAPLMEFERDTVCFTTDRDAVRVPIHKACQAIWGLPRQNIGTARLMRIMREAV